MRPCRVICSNAGHALLTGVAAPDRAARVAETLFRVGSFSGWGIRTVAMSAARYNPISYHNGSVWPHDNAMIALGLSRYDFKQPVLRILTGMFNAASYWEPRRLPELFCGFARRRTGPTMYPVACSPQAWASAAVLALVQASLGLQFDPAACEIRFEHPMLPAFLDRLHVRGLRLGDAEADVLLHRSGEEVAATVTRRCGEVRIVIVHYSSGHRQVAHPLAVKVLRLRWQDAHRRFALPHTSDRHVENAAPEPGSRQGGEEALVEHRIGAVGLAAKRGAVGAGCGQDDAVGRRHRPRREAPAVAARSDDDGRQIGAAARQRIGQGCRRQKFLRIGEHEPFAVLAMRGDKDQAPVTGPCGQRGDAPEQLLPRSGLGGKPGTRRAGTEAMDVAGENAVAGEPRAEGRDRIVEDRFSAVAGCQHSLPMTARGNRALAARGQHDEQKGSTEKQGETQRHRRAISSVCGVKRGARGRGYYKAGALWHCCGDSVQLRAMPRPAGGGRLATAATLAQTSCTPCH